jgi:ankyrin repeat protein
LIKEFAIDVNNQNLLCGNTALLETANYGREEIVKYLLSRQADVNIRSKVSRSPLQEAVSKGHSYCVRLLLEAGANARKEGLLLDTMLNDNYTNIKLLINGGVDVNARFSTKGILLKQALIGGRADIISYLVSQGANINRCKGSEKALLIHAIEYQQPFSVKSLLKHGVSTNGEEFLHYAARNGSTAVLQELLAIGMDINMRDSKGRTAVEEARAKGHEDVVAFLLSQGAATDTTASGKTSRGKR